MTAPAESVTAPEPRCRCSEGPEAWQRCPLPQHDHTKWTEHGWNCPASCQHPDALAAHAEFEPVAAAEPVHFDTVRGHIRVGELVFADLGNATLQVWSHERCTLTPDTARDLATALTAWAARS